MYKRFLPLIFVGAALLFLINFSCTKLDTTSLGGDLIPVVDNINTFSDTISITTTQGYFDDTTKVANAEAHALGVINADPLFGTTKASVFLQLKPPFYPFFFGNATDTLVRVDSMVVCLSYIGVYGDSLTPQDIQVQEIFDDNFRDSVSQLRSVKYQPASLGPVLGTTSVNIVTLKSQIKISNNKDSVTNQIRIKITDPAFIDRLFTADSTALGTFHSDSLFRRDFNGFAVSPAGNTGKALMYLNILDAKTRLEIHYVKKNKGILDSTYSSFGLYSGNSSSANRIERGYTGYPVANPEPDAIYLQTAPGTYANLKIDTLDRLSNRIIHRAELLMEQTPGDLVSDELYTAPNYLYLDLIDSTIVPKWKALYFDLNPTTPYDPDFKTGYPYFPTAGVEPTYFGGTRKLKLDGAGRTIATYNINLTRYIQQFVTKRTPNYTLRLFPAFNISYPQYGKTIFPFYNNIANGRVKLAGGSSPEKNKRIRLVVIWSKLN